MAIVPNAGVYEIGEVNLYYSTSCPSKGDISKYANSTSLSACVKSRLTACNNLMNSSPILTEWLPLPNPFSQSIVNDDGSDPQIIAVANLFVIPSLIASSLATALNLSSDIKQNIGKCLFLSIFSIDLFKSIGLPIYWTITTSKYN
jgi:hypothetical protein